MVLGLWYPLGEEPAGMDFLLSLGNRTRKAEVGAAQGFGDDVQEPGAETLGPGTARVSVHTPTPKPEVGLA